MVVWDQGDTVRMANLKCQQQDCISAIEIMIHIVSHEEVVGLRDVATLSEQLPEVIELSLAAATCCDWQVQVLHFALQP